MRIRPIAHSDIASLHGLAREVGGGFASLLDEGDFLSGKIARALAAFERQENQGQQLYLFVLEDERNGEVVGCCAIESNVGQGVPYYRYHLGSLMHASPRLSLHRRLETLTLCSEHTDNVRLCSLFLRESWRRRDRNGVLLSRSRWLSWLSFTPPFPLKYGSICAGH